MKCKVVELSVGFMFLQSKWKCFVLNILVLLSCSALPACGSGKNVDGETEVLIETSKGDIRVKLYNDTPLHRDNFVKLAKAGVYDGVVFHRVIRNFMVQTGDPLLKASGYESVTDSMAYEYTVPAEICCPKHFHKKGALAAARESDWRNPEKASSGTQFYIVTGRPYKGAELMELYSAIYQSKIDTLYEHLAEPYFDRMVQMRRQGCSKQLSALQDSLLLEAENYVAENPPLEFTKAQKQAYVTVGGAPHLDGEYTVFGEVVEGMDVVEAIGKIRTSGERPLQEVVVRRVKVLD